MHVNQYPGHASQIIRKHQTMQWTAQNCVQINSNIIIIRPLFFSQVGIKKSMELFQLQALKNHDIMSIAVI